MATPDLFTVVFEQFLRISPQLISKYPTVQDQLLYLILIPHAILILFLIAFGRGMVGRAIGQHKGLNILISVIAYVYIIWSGWYGTLLVPLTIGWFYIALVITLFVFFISIIWHPAAAPAGASLAHAVAGAITQRTIGRQRDIERLHREIEAIDRSIERIHREMDERPELRQRLADQIGRFERRRQQIEIELERLGG